MLSTLSLLVVVGFSSAALLKPGAKDYANLVTLWNKAILPWPGIGPPYVSFTPAQLVALGQQNWPNLPSSQNATALALTVWDWTSPDFRRPNFLLTARGNFTTFAALITYQPPSSYPDVAAMFGLTGTTVPQVLQQLKANYSLVTGWCASEATVLQYALYELPEVQYSDPNSPAVLFRGDGRDVTFFCNQFVSTWGLSIDDCVARVFQPQATVTVHPFWSTTPLASVTAGFTASVFYNIIPNADASVRSSWHSRPISAFSVDPSQQEFLYPSNSRFAVLSANCSVNPNNNANFWNITLVEINPLASVRWQAAPPVAAVTQCVSP
jgi:hypothetical protein